MKQFIYKFAMFIAVLSFLTSFFSGVSVLTSIFRSVVVFLGTLIIIIMALNILRWGLLNTSAPVEGSVNQKAIENKSK